MRLPPVEVGARYGRLTVEAPAEKMFVGGSFRSAWHVRCDCAERKVILAQQLKGGIARSCGCLARETTGALRRTHGRWGSREYNAWHGMIQRCANPNEPKFHLYGGRGIRVCDRWRDFAHFFADMGERPPGTSLDRIDSNGHYEPGNCRWATITEQNENTRRTIRVLVNDERMSLKRAAGLVGVSYSTMRARAKKAAGGPQEAIDEALSRCGGG